MKLYGQWRPGGFPPVVTLITKLTLFGMMIVRGADYTFGDDPFVFNSLSAVEAAAPIHWWGIVCLGAGLMGYCGMLLRRAGMVLWGHVVGASLYMSFGIGALLNVVHLAEDPDRGLFPLLALLAVAIWLVVSSRRHDNYSQSKIVGAALTATIGVAIITYGLDGLRSATVFVGIAAVHVLMAIGTAARQRQMSILEARSCE